MKAPTHVMFGLLAGSYMGATSALPLVIGSLLPDIDHPRSTLGKFLPIGYLIKHRTITHSILAAAIIWWIHPWVGVGYASHLLLDSLNPMGVPFLYPVSYRFNITRIRTGSGWEMILAAGLMYAMYHVNIWTMGL